MKDFSKLQDISNDISKAKPLNAYMVFNNLPSIQYYIKSFSFPSVNVGETMIPYPKHTNLYIPSNHGEVQEINVSFFADEYLINYLAIMDWMNDIQNKKDFKDLLTDASIVIMDNSKNTILKIYLYDCFPSSLGGIDFSVENPEPLLPYMSLKCNRFVWEYAEHDIRGCFGTNEKYI